MSSFYLRTFKHLAKTNMLLANSLKEKEELLTELERVNKELIRKNNDCVELTEDLRIANLQLNSEYKTLEDITRELIDIKLQRKNEKVENEKRNLELIISFKALKTSEEYERFFVRGLAEMMFLTSHKVRKPVTNIIGISGILEQSINSPQKLRRLVNYIKDSAVSLDIFTKELSVFMSSLEKKVKRKN